MRKRIELQSLAHVLCFYFSMCVSTLVCAVKMHVRAQDNLECHSSTAVHLFVLGFGSFTGLALVKLLRLAGHQDPEIYLPLLLQCWYYRHTTPVIFVVCFYVGSKDQIQGSCALTASLCSPTLFLKRGLMVLQASLELVIKPRLVSNSWFP